MVPPTPLPNEVLVEIRACGLCRTDLHVIEGDLLAKPLPHIPGHQIVGTIKEIGASVTQFHIGQRVGIAWLRSTCGHCKFCLNHQENLCDFATFNGWSHPGGFAEFITAPAEFTYPLPDHMSDEQVAPLLCAGIIGFRSLRLSGIKNWQGTRVGLYGFGSAAHIAIQLLRSWGAEVYVISRTQKHLNLAKELGAFWVGTKEVPPKKLDTAIIFAPAGDLVYQALIASDKGASVVCAGIHMSPIPSLPYDILYGERLIRSVTNNTRQDSLDFLQEAQRCGITTNVNLFPLHEANEALYALKYDGFQGSGVLIVK